MRFQKIAFLFIAGAFTFMLSEAAQAQTPPKAAAPAPARATATASPRRVEANLAQLMRGIFFPNSNVIFAAQNEDPKDVKADKDPSMATNPLAGTYGQWQAVENSGLAIAEAASLLTVPGRKCSNGAPVPIQNANWGKFVQEVRDAGMAAYKAAQSKNQDNILMAADTLTTACSNCHEKYREKPNLADRCK